VISQQVEEIDETRLDMARLDMALERSPLTPYGAGYKKGWQDRDRLCLANCACKEVKSDMT
jgi:hypothetical protein